MILVIGASCRRLTEHLLAMLVESNSPLEANIGRRNLALESVIYRRLPLHELGTHANSSQQLLNRLNILRQGQVFGFCRILSIFRFLFF